ncbi:hypothetical protein E2320_001972 [Naja naja]|nr:hypothetical protein E2320_001972 [Naja naja]
MRQSWWQGVELSISTCQTPTKAGQGRERVQPKSDKKTCELIPFASIPGLTNTFNTYSDIVITELNETLHLYGIHLHMFLLSFPSDSYPAFPPAAISQDLKLLEINIYLKKEGKMKIIVHSIVSSETTTATENKPDIIRDQRFSYLGFKKINWYIKETMKKPGSPISSQDNISYTSDFMYFHESDAELTNKDSEEEKEREKKHTSFTLCNVCNIQLNSAAQAQIHYHGKSHQKRLKQLNNGNLKNSFGELLSIFYCVYIYKASPQGCRWLGQNAALLNLVFFMVKSS